MPLRNIMIAMPMAASRELRCAFLSLLIVVNCVLACVRARECASVYGARANVFVLAFALGSTNTHVTS